MHTCGAALSSPTSSSSLSSLSSRELTLAVSVHGTPARDHSTCASGAAVERRVGIPAWHVDMYVRVQLSAHLRWRAGVADLESAELGLLVQVDVALQSRVAVLGSCGRRVQHLRRGHPRQSTVRRVQAGQERRAAGARARE
jgi:hypothetical protein